MSSTPASMLQIVASGLQDRERLNAPGGRPSIQFYKSVMRKRTRWASQWRRVEFDNLADFGRTAICTIPIQGELITRATLVIDLPDIYTPQMNAIQQQYEVNFGRNRVVSPFWAWTNGIGHAICSDVQMLIGDQIIDQFDSRALEVLDEQEKPVEHFNSTDTLIARDPSTFTDQQTLQYDPNTPPLVPQTNPQTLEIVFPFWWNRGPGPQPLPIQALAKDKVQLKVTFRPVQQCVYTSTRIDPRNPPLSANQGTGPLPNITDCGFFINDSTGQPIYNAASTADLSAQSVGDGFMGSVLPSPRMPTSYHFQDAYWIIEYVSLEDREASAYRMADLEIPIEQHMPLPVITTGGAENIRIRIDKGGLVRDLKWVAQRTEATDYNAYFLFSKDLGPAAGPPTLMGPTPLAPTQNPCDIPWWPDAQIPNWDFGDGYIVPAFVDRQSDPIAAAKMLIRGMPRFEHEGPSIFRSLIPALNCKRTPLIDRYIYRYDFGFWPTGGLAEALYLPIDEIRGYSNWDKLPKRELALTMNQDTCSSSQWVIDDTQTPLDVSGSAFALVDSHFSPNTDGFLVNLVGAQPDLSDGMVDVLGNNGDGAIVLGIIDYNQLRRQPGYQGLYLRLNDQGSSSLLLKTTVGYKWIAVAASGGYGDIQYGGGGYAGSAVEIGWQGSNINQTHDAMDSSGGVYVYSNMNNLDTVFQPITVITSPNFEMIANGTLKNVQLTFSLDASPNLTTPAVEVQVNVTSAITLLTTTYTLTVPISLTALPYQPFTMISPIPIPVQVNDLVAITFGANDNGMPYVRVGQVGPPYTLSTKFEVAQSGNVVVFGDSPIYIYGGGGGGRGPGIEGVGLPDGQKMSTTAAFVESHQQTGGSQNTYRGGDGFYGGGSGTLCGGGGGSYVSDLISQVNTFENPNSSVVAATLTPLRLVSTNPPNFNIYSWVTRYNRLRINSGRGALMFNEAT